MVRWRTQTKFAFSMRTSKWPWDGWPRDGGNCSVTRDSEGTAPSHRRGPVRESCSILFLFCTRLFTKRAISKISGLYWACVDSERRTASSLPHPHSPRAGGSEDTLPPRASLPSPSRDWRSQVSALHSPPRFLKNLYPMYVFNDSSIKYPHGTTD